MEIKFGQGSTKRGIVRLVSCVALSYAAYKGDITMIGAIVAAAQAANGILGITQDDSIPSTQGSQNG